MSANILFGGVNFTIDGEGGPDCVSFLSESHRLIETLTFVCINGVILLWAARKVSLPQQEISNVKIKTQNTEKILFVILLTVFLLEVSYKALSRQMLWLLNPCHMLTLLQLLLLYFPSSPASRVLFRLHLYWLTGPVLAILFPVTWTREMPGEVANYWIQHFLIILLPGYLMTQGRYAPMFREQEDDENRNYMLHHNSDNRDPSGGDSGTSAMAWPLLSYSVFSLYHWVFLQSIGLMTQVNLNNMLCPAASDPFYSPHYRSLASLYLGVLSPGLGELYIRCVTRMNLKRKQD